ncbi:MAG: hypothetical protein KDB65_04820 [Calditrichaeota bacterium]|nr:hypothetical protein [Calditrichota bacterium]MCB9368358.1 hypothetical protein [Calditrichota bacterium]
MKTFVFVMCLASAVMGQVTIDQSNWPYGSDQIGNYWNYFNTSSNVAVNLGTINPLQQGGTWDFSTGPTTSTATSEIRTVAAAPQPAPAQTTFTEYQTQGGQAQWLYEDETATGTFARGVSQNGSVYPYDAPFWNIYHYPMTYGTTWSSSWTWGEEALGVPIQETRDCEIVGWGMVTVPFGGPMQCLVMRTLQTSYAEFMGIPILDQLYRSYEWIVPGIGSVVAILSVDGETSWLFNTASGYFRLDETNLGGDLQPPVIAGVTDLPDSPSPGPYSVSATITDDSGIESTLLYYSVDGGGYASTGPSNVNGNIFTFEIPTLTGSPVQEVRYYIWARDNSVNQNSATNPANAPTTYFSFSWINDNLPPVFTGVTVWPSPTNFNGPYPVQATITDDNGILFASLHYRFGSGAWEEVPSGGNVGDVYSFEIPSISATTIVRYYLEAVDNSGFFNTGFYPAAGQSGPVVFQAVFTIPADPRAVEDLTIVRVGDDILLNWSPVTQDINGNPVIIDHYDIYRGTAGDGSDLTLFDSSTTSDFTDTGVLAGQPMHQYVVIAVSQ